MRAGIIGTLSAIGLAIGGIGLLALCRAPGSALAAQTGDKSPPAAKAPAPRGEPRPGDRPPGPPSRSRRYRPLTKEQEQEVLNYLKEKRPEDYERVLKDRERDPRRYRRTIAGLWQWVSRFKQMPKDLRDAYEDRHRAFVDMWRLAKQRADAKDPAARNRIDKRLYEVCARLFDAEQIIREYRLKQMEEQIKRLREDLKERARNRKTVIGEMVERFARSAADRNRKRSPTTRPTRGRKPSSGQRPAPKPDASRGRS